MAGIVRAYCMLMCGYQLLYPVHRLLATGLPTAVAPDNETVYDNTQGNANLTSGDIWLITETAGNESAKDPDVLINRGGWTSKTQNSKLNLETEEGWLNSAMIAKDAYIPYRAVGATKTWGNSSEEWKKILVKPDA